MPDYQISCMWLPVRKLNLLCKRLDELWAENSGTVILYTWTQFLKEESLEYLEIHQSLDLTRRYLGEIRRLGSRNHFRQNGDTIVTNKSECTNIQKVESPTNLANETSLSVNNSRNNETRTEGFGNRSDSMENVPPSPADMSTRKRFYHQRRPAFSRFSQERSYQPLIKDPRIVFQSLPSMYTHQYIVAFNEERIKIQFQKNIYLCEICFQDKMGEKCVQFQPCDHVYCKDCVKEYFETRIKDGMVQTMPCPYDKCDSEANQSQIKEVIGPNLYDKYDDLLLNATLNKMEDITYCPRQSCGIPVMREVDDKMAVCSSCRFVFCIFCKMTYHGVEPCKLKSEEKRQIVEEYEQGDNETKFRLEKRYGKKQLQAMVQVHKSESWISTNSKACPSCGANIEKSDGCNKMICWQCKEFFCWLCRKTLDQNAPYQHYLDPASKCNNQLFYGTELDEEEPPPELLAALVEEDLLEILEEGDEFIHGFAHPFIPRVRWRVREQGDRILVEEMQEDEEDENLDPNNIVVLL
ncbi:E3 ubiquitin-protein ligase RNF14-like isoform X2 [Rhodnius prolixus]